MEKMKFLHTLYALLTLSLYIHTPIIFANNSPQSDSTTSILDVSSSLQRTLQLVLSSDSDRQQGTVKRHGRSSLNLSTISLSLHPRSSLHKPLHKDYAALTLSRLNRDSTRLQSIYSSLQFNNPKSFQTPLTSGVRLGSGEYFCRIGIGTPPRDYYMVIDTGSDVNWLQCKSCVNCYQQTDPIFDPINSSSYRQLSCGSTQCLALQVSACRVNSCLYQVSYGDGSFTVGNFATETLLFGKSSIPNVPIGCGHNNQGLFVSAAGIIGLGGGTLSLPSQLKAKSFSYCLVDRDSSGSSTLEFNSVTPVDSVFAPLIRNPKTRTYTYIGLTGISVGARPVTIPPTVFKIDNTGRGGTIIDCGTAVTRLQVGAYNPVRDAFRQLTQNLTSADGVSIFDTCYDFSSTPTVIVPTVWLVFEGGKILRLKPDNYLVPVNSGGKFCFAFAPTDRPLSILGNIQQQGTRVSYDLVNSVIGFSPNKC
ncbi:protein ASPARTIC PROTEASE IN GUARD CELL 1-like [Impatiens glandulifera]|uniref:protein ASPARTIC PROTEASE IN GUARD CELL 1-like n=1 Tax=Impatiens glandulifera TaxID=253017 RepID=UPI001FB10A57|nr:protein ASPARTIC PROTEASE IN GUARD CELL 1-like [Impatiens glandulifera]